MLGRYASELLVICVGVLTAIGLVMLFSVTQLAGAEGLSKDFLMQLAWLGISAVACIFFALIDYRVWENWAWPIFWLAVFFLALCFAPGISHQVNGAKRWISARPIGLAQIRFQPSEFARLAAVIFLAAWYNRPIEQLNSFWRSFLAPGLAVLLIVGLIGAEVDLGSSAVLAFTVGVMMMMAGVKYSFLVPTALGTALCLGFVITQMPERMGRLLAFLHPEQYPKDAFQQVQALLALACGGWHGVGIGQRAEYVYSLPEADTDFIFAVIGSELGLQMSLLIVLAYVVIMVGGMIVALNSADRFGTLLAVGIVSLIVIQAIINIGVVTMALPNKGLALPFISRGGTSLLACMSGIGMIISIHRHGWRENIYTAPKLARTRITPSV